MDSSTVNGKLRRASHSSSATSGHGQVQGLPHLQLSKGRAKLKAKLLRQWTLAKHGRQRDSVQCHAFLPFMEISVAVQDTLDLVRSSVEEEIVFQATLNVPTHHAIACRIEAFGTPFVAPALHDSPSEWTDDDLQYAACLASPSEIEEVPSLGISTRVASFVESRAPALKEASAFASLSFSVRQRQSRQQSVGDDEDLPPADNLTRAGSRSARSSLEFRRQHTTSMQPAIAEEDSVTMWEEEPDIRSRASPLQMRSVARLQSFGPGSRQPSHEVELVVPPSANGLAALMGVGFFVMQQWQWVAKPGGPLNRNINPWTALLPPGGANAAMVPRTDEGPGRMAGAAPAVAAS